MPAGTHGHSGPVVQIGAATVLEQVDRVIAAHPQAPALKETSRAVTYAELDRLADAAAASLQRDHGVGRGDVVAITAQPGIDFAAVLLGTLRAGAAYLPIDLAYPKQRIDQIFRASPSRLMAFTTDGDAGEYLKSHALPDGGNVTTLGRLLEGNGDGTRPGAGRAGLQPGDPAYVIFSSGSTGIPKGIVQTHRTLVNLISWEVGGTNLGQRRRVLHVAPISFDVSVQEIFYTLTSAGCLFVPDPEVKRDLRDLVDYIIGQGVELVNFPQSAIDMIMSLPRNFRDAPALRHIISTGETVRVTPAIEALLTERPELTFHNHYGPAENHVVAGHSMSSVTGNLEPLPPVGSLIWNTYIYILDERQQPVADGETGEIYIGGAGLAIGYTDPELTKAGFIPDPFRRDARIYRTRDRGIWRPDGTLQLLGRIDDLIKIRGYAVEPREVEVHLARCPGVQLAAVFGVTRADGAVELQAALTGEPPPAPELRRILRAELPDYMVPVRWWLAESLPFSPNGKLNRTALPGPHSHPMPMVVHQPDHREEPHV